MAMIVRVIYENGVLRPLEPLDLTEGQTATATIQIQAETQTDRESIKNLFGDRVEWSDPNDDRNAWTEDMAEEIDRAFQGDPPLSQIVIEDRGET